MSRVDDLPMQNLWITQLRTRSRHRHESPLKYKFQKHLSCFRDVVALICKKNPCLAFSKKSDNLLLILRAKHINWRLLHDMTVLE